MWWLMDLPAGEILFARDVSAPGVKLGGRRRITSAAEQRFLGRVVLFTVEQ